jgi:hypothetical protein
MGVVVVGALSTILQSYQHHSIEVVHSDLECDAQPDVLQCGLMKGLESPFCDLFS